MNPDTIFWALLGGILPALVWFWFWKREDNLHPEPRSALMLTFFAGMVAVPLAIPLQRMLLDESNMVATFFWWASAEELLKYLLAYFVAFRAGFVDEPIDAMMYLLTVALGFAAAENTLFLLQPLIDGNISEALIVGNLRFVGATLLHVLCSAFIGFMIALTLYKGRFTRTLSLGIGIVGAITLHALFNVVIMKESEISTLLAFSGVWVLIIALMLGFERAKRVYPVDKLELTYVHSQ